MLPGFEHQKFFKNTYFRSACAQQA
jgi:hypothetical protein